MYTILNEVQYIHVAKYYASLPKRAYSGMKPLYILILLLAVHSNQARNEYLEFSTLAVLMPLRAVANTLNGAKSFRQMMIKRPQHDGCIQACLGQEEG